MHTWGRGPAVSELIQTTHEQQGPIPSHGNAVAVFLFSSPPSKLAKQGRSGCAGAGLVVLLAATSRGRGAVRRTGGGELGRTWPLRRFVAVEG